MELGVALRVDGDLEQWQENVLHHFLEVGQLILGVVNIAVERAN